MNRGEKKKEKVVIVVRCRPTQRLQCRLTHTQLAAVVDTITCYFVLCS